MRPSNNILRRNHVNVNVNANANVNVLQKHKKPIKSRRKRRRYIQYVFLSIVAILMFAYVAKIKHIFQRVNETYHIHYSSAKEDILHDFPKEKSNKKHTHHKPSNIAFLNMSDSSIFQQQQQSQSSEFKIDILTIGSIYSLNRANAQLKTWASHTSTRHYFLATEYDDPDPTCHTTMTLEDISSICTQCKSLGGRKYWRSMSSLNELTRQYKNQFAKEDWLLEKSNPTGWLCGQKRFINAFSKLMTMYRDASTATATATYQKNDGGVETIIPDYLVFGDDDTYVNLEMLENELLKAPMKQVKEEKLTFEEEMKMVYPTPNTPVVWAGCRVRRPTYQIDDTFPFGGFGIMFSKAAIERFIQPLYCNETMTGWEREACEHWTIPTYEYRIGEKQFFEPGMSLSDLMGTYVQKLKPFCLHSDWMISYFVNHFNISRHVVPTGHIHGKEQNHKMYWYNDNMGHVKHARLHAWDDGSESYLGIYGNCNNTKETCNETSRTCHYMDETSLWNLHKKNVALFPDKYR